jgi:hypothetical protein
VAPVTIAQLSFEGEQYLLSKSGKGRNYLMRVERRRKRNLRRGTRKNIAAMSHKVHEMLANWKRIYYSSNIIKYDNHYIT